MDSPDVTLFFSFVRNYVLLTINVIFLNSRNALKGLWVADGSMIFEGKSFSNLIQVQSGILTMEKYKMNKTTLPKLRKKSYSINLM
jgi:hypothetical protein